ncbi:MAG: hypothetical protein ABIJ23_04225 [Candidatus Magasanikbacteria bacterium]
MIKKTKEKKNNSLVLETEEQPEIGVKLDELDQASLKELVEKNIKWSQVIYEQNKKIKHRLTLMAVGSYLRLAIFLIPLILAFIYLPPLIEGLLSQYQSVLGGASGSPSQINDLLGQASSGQLQEILKAFGNR